MIFFIITTVIATITAIYYYKNSRENYRLFELSRAYSTQKDGLEANKYHAAFADYNAQVAKQTGIKLNKDGSIAKKRGRPPKAK